MKNKNVLIFLFVLILIIPISGITYAYLSNKTIQNDTNNVATLNCLSVFFINEENTINLTNAYPISDFTGELTIPYRFTIKNNCDIDVSTSINLESLNPDNLSSEEYLNNYLSDGYIKVKLNSDDYEINTTDILSNYGGC